MQLLFMACRRNVREVEDFLNEGTDVNNIDLDRQTALHIATCEGHDEVVKRLLNYKSKIWKGKKNRKKSPNRLH